MSMGLIVNGTITRTKVAPGADLVAYSGFSASNYLEQPYNSDLDFGTGDFCIMGWVQLDSVGGGLQSMIFRRTSDNNDGYQVYFDTSGRPVMETRQSSSNSTSTGDALSTGAWNFICGLVKNSGTLLELYQNGGLRDSASITARNVGVDATLRIGNNNAGTQQLNGSLALLRISATVPTAEQIAKIYNDEKALFQENAQATLYGASDAVTALAHDPDTDLLHVGTSAGRSVFEGLRRVGNTTTSVSTSISASGGLIVEK